MAQLAVSLPLYMMEMIISILIRFYAMRMVKKNVLGASVKNKYSKYKANILRIFEYTNK